MEFRTILIAFALVGLLSLIGVAYAYSSELILDNSIEVSTGYCEISSDSQVVTINGNSILFKHEGGEDEDCTITYHHYPSYLQSGIINMDVTIEDSSASHTSIVISMTSGGDVIGSTTLSGTGGVLSGTISGIGPLSNNGSLTFSLTLPPDVSFSSNATIDLNFVAYPLSEGN